MIDVIAVVQKINVGSESWFFYRVLKVLRAGMYSGWVGDDVKRIDDLKEHFLESKRINIARILSYDFTNLSEIEDICEEIDAIDGLVIDLSALMNLNVYNSQYIGRVFFSLSRVPISFIFWLNKLKYESVLKELPLLFEDEEINENFANPEVQNFNPDDETKDSSDTDFSNKIQEAASNLIGHDLFKGRFCTEV